MAQMKPVPIWPGSSATAPAPSAQQQPAPMQQPVPAAFVAPGTATHPVDPWGNQWGGKQPAATPATPAQTASALSSFLGEKPAAPTSPMAAVAMALERKAVAEQLDKDTLEVIEEAIASGDKWIVVYDGNRAVASYSPALGKPSLIQLIAEALRQNPERTLDLQA